ncbi:MAG: DNA translocase FtsK, partial [Candidatus Gottesmanbacteria bacterium]
KQTIYTVSAIWLWIFSAIIILSFFGEGTTLMRLRDGLYTKIGWLIYPLPVFLVSLSMLFFKVKSDLAKPNVPAGFFLFLLSLIGLTQAGMMGEWMMRTLSNAMTVEVAYLILIGVFIIGLIIEFNTSLDAFINALLMGVQRIMEWIGGFFKHLVFPKETFVGGAKQMKIKGGEFMDKPMTIKGSTPLHPTIPGKSAPVASGIHKPMDLGGDFKISSSMTPQEQLIWEYPPVSLLSDGPNQRADRGDVKYNADTIKKTLGSFGIMANVVEVNKGPAITEYALEIALGTKVSKIQSLSSDLALALAAPTGQVRIQTPIPGRNLVGIEIPNRGLEFVTLKHMLESDVLAKAKSKLTVALGLDVAGNPVTVDIGKMPHMLIAGTTGSGKSVLVNAFITSLLFRTTPQEVKLIMIDPKRVELTGYNGIPHLLAPVIVDADKALSALHYAAKEMEVRYKQLAEVGVKNIDSFNELAGMQSMPYILIFIDELATLMAYAPVDAEDTICKIAQMSRAVGIHLVLATQRPSVDVITGLIKANIPCRIAFNVSSMIDSRVVLDMPGAEKLLGRGDMLFIPPDQSKPTRIQGTYVSEQEVNKVVEFLKTKNYPVQYTDEVVNTPISAMHKGGISVSADGKDPLFDEAFRLICQHDKASASLLQRRLSVGYARAARILDQLEAEGIISAGEGAKPRDVLIKNPDDYYANQQQQGQ